MRLSRLLVAAAVLAACPAALAAQQSIRAGQTIQGRLDSSDAAMGDGSLYDQYVYDGRPGDRLVITMQSSDFDTFLHWGTLQGGSFESEETDDDGGGGTDSRLEVTVGGDGRYAIRANALMEGETGAYTLSVERAGGPAPGPSRGRAPAMTPIRIGQTVSGTLDGGDPVMDDGSLYDAYVLRGDAGERLVVTMESDDFDTFLTVGSWDGSTFEALASDDDGGGGTDSRVEITLPRGGEYGIRANALMEGETGGYRLSVQRAGGPAPRPGSSAPSAEGSISAGETVRGRLDASDPTMDDGSHFDRYVYQGRPGEQVVVTLRSDDFDTFLGWGPLGDGGYQHELSDDDGGGGTNSQLTATVGSAGTYVIVANAFQAGATGNYTLSVQRVGGPQAGPGGTTVAAGQTVAGRLDSGDTQLSDGSYVDTWTYRGQAGEEILVTLASSDFDTYLGLARGGELLQHDDDSGGGTNSRIQARLDQSGTYHIQANAFQAGATGSYTLSVERVGENGRQPRMQTVALGQSVDGRLDSSDAVATDDSYYDLYQYQGRPGEQIVVTLRSPDFDAYLGWGRMVGERFEAEQNDDDSGGGTDAQMVVTIPPSGTYAIAANSLRARETGRYQLSIERAGGTARTPGTPAPRGAATVAAGERASGTLAAGDAMLQDSSLYDLYVYRGSPGDRLEITLTSPEFDTFLTWGRLEGADFSREAYDDDGGGGTDSRLEVTVGGTGTYAIQANAFAPGATGRYTLQVRPLTAERPAPVAETERAPSRLQGKWLYAYAEPRDGSLRTVGNRMKEGMTLERLTEQLNASFPLPRNVPIRMDQCGMINAFYSPSDALVVFCYELAAHLVRTFAADGRWTPEQREAVEGAIHFIAMHEVGHALVDQLDLPVTGREEDAVDQLAAMILLGTGEKGAEAALNGVLAIQPGEGAVFDDADFADEHSLGPVRLYNIVCWIYGSDPRKYGGIVTNGMLPRERAVRCPGEYEQLSKAWTRLLAPYRGGE